VAIRLFPEKAGISERMLRGNARRRAHGCCLTKQYARLVSAETTRGSELAVPTRGGGVGRAEVRAVEHRFGIAHDWAAPARRISSGPKQDARARLLRLHQAFHEGGPGRGQIVRRSGGNSAKISSAQVSSPSRSLRRLIARSEVCCTHRHWRARPAGQRDTPYGASVQSSSNVRATSTAPRAMAVEERVNHAEAIDAPLPSRG